MVFRSSGTPGTLRPISSVPVVGTRVVGSVDAVEDDRTGLLVEPGSSAALGGAILRLFTEPALRQRLTAGAASWVRQECSRDTMTARTESLYEAIAQGR